MTATLSAFVGRSFLDIDKSVWHELRDILDSLKPMGFDYEDAKEAQLRPISEKVKELIARHEIYLGLVTRRYPIWEPPLSWLASLSPLRSYKPSKWTTSEWVVEEIGYAMGRDKKVLLLIEAGVNFPVSDLDADTQYISFNREALTTCQTELSQMILGMISTRVAVTTQEPPATSGATQLTEEENADERAIISQIGTIISKAEEGAYSTADELQENYLKSASEEIRDLHESILLRFRAEKNDISALTRLKEKCKLKPVSSAPQLAHLFTSFGDHQKAAEILLSNLESFPKNEKTSLIVSAARSLRHAEKATDAIDLLLSQLNDEPSESERIYLYKEMANSAEALGSIDLEISLLERLLDMSPSESSARFRLAWLYSGNDHNKLAAYHYKLLEEHTKWPEVTNNLAAAYGSLGHKGKEFGLYSKVSDTFPLAKANLANLLASIGSLSEAETLAKAVISDSSNSDVAMSRARYVLEEIEKTTKKEKEDIGQIANNTKNERDFFCAYAEAYCSLAISIAAGVFKTVHGNLSIQQIGEKVVGSGTVEQIVKQGGLASLLNPSLKPSIEPEIRRYSLSLVASTRGRAGEFKLTITPEEKGLTILGSIPREINGLLYFDPEGKNIQFLEREGKNSTIVSANRIE